jgi:hypothetical protein
MENRAFKDEIYGQFAHVGSALSNPHRLELPPYAKWEARSQEAPTMEALIPSNKRGHAWTNRN